MAALSIAIVVYNDYVDAYHAVETIEKHTSISDKKIYIIDNSCREDSDNEKEKFRWLLECFDDIEYIDTKQNRGFGAGHNRIIPELDSKYHAIVNPDIILKEDSFKVLIRFMDDTPDCGMAIPRIISEEGVLQEAYRAEPTFSEMFKRFFLRRFCEKSIQKGNLRYEDYSKPFQVPFAQGCFLVIRTELFKEVNGFDERFFLYLEDADLSKRVNEVSKVLYCPDTEVIHKWEMGSHKKLGLFLEHVKSMIHYFRKWRRR